HVELERRRDVAGGGRQRASSAEAALPTAQIKMTVLAELFGGRGKPRRTVDVVPVRIVLLDVDDRVRLTEPVDLQRRRAARWRLLRPGRRRRRERQERRDRDRPERGALLFSAHRCSPLMLAFSHALTRRLASSKRRS